MADSKKKALWPALDMAELLQVLGELGISMTAEQLKQPSPELAFSTYRTLAERVWNLSADDLAPTFNSLEAFEFPAIHEEALAQLNVFRAIQRLMSNARIPNFGFHDLYEPKPDRFRFVLSGIINFVRFSDDVRRNVQEQADELGEAEDQRQAVEDEAIQIEVNVQSLRAQREAEKPIIAQQKQREEELAAKIKAAWPAAEQLRKEADRLRKEGMMAKEKLEKVEMAITEVRRECNALEAQIVRSPDRMKKRLATLSDQLAQIQQQIRETEQQTREKQARLEVLEHAEEDIGACIRVLQECEANLNKCRALSRENKQIQEDIASLEAKSRDLTTQEQHLKRQIKAAEEKLFRQQKQQELRREAASDALSAAREQHQTAQREHAAAMQQSAEASQRAAACRSKTEAALRAHETEMALWRSKLQEMTAAASEYHARLQAAVSAQ